MFATYLGNTVVFFLLVGNGYSTPVVEYDKALRYEEYVVDHEISSGQAKNSALTIDIQSVQAPPGCQDCTFEEKKYCLGTDLINDHCCCDRRYEYFPFVPHTCYTGKQLCAPVLGNCEQYSRLRTCCCDKFVLEKWKEKFNSSSCKGTNGVAYTLIISHIVYLFVNYFVT